MSVQLEAIAFNHDPGSAVRDAFNIRANATRFLAVPEWQRGINAQPGDSLAAYALTPTRGQTLTIRAAFSRLTDDLSSAEVRAVPTSPGPSAPPWAPLALSFVARFYPQYYPFYYYHLLQLTILDALGSTDSLHALGTVQPRVVQFGADGRTGLEVFELANPDLSSGGVGIHTISWRWEFRGVGRSSWTEFARTSHRIFAVLDVPNEPWQQFPYSAANTQLPWTDVLERACVWAAGANDADSIASRVTHAVNGLGDVMFDYGCPIGGLTQYTSVLLPYFYCTAFLDRLEGGPGYGPFINCSDCASVVSTFSNALGCDLWQSRMGSGLTFELNPILAIGSHVWRPACGWPGFDMHEVAWAFPCGENENVFDASLRVDADLNPAAPPHTPLLPTDLRFGTPGDGQYLDHLTTVRGRPFCRPQQWTRQRRLVV